MLRRALQGLKNIKLGLTSGITMSMYLSIGPVVSLIAGILILIVPRLLNYIVAIYLILMGLIGLFGNGSMHLH